MALTSSGMNKGLPLLAQLEPEASPAETEPELDEAPGPEPEAPAEPNQEALG